MTNINFLPITLIHTKRKGDKKEWNDPLGKMTGSLKKFSHGNRSVWDWFFSLWILGLKCPSLKIGQEAAKTKRRSPWCKRGKIEETYH